MYTPCRQAHVFGQHPYRVLVIDDDPRHAMLIKLAFAQADSDAYVRVARCAEEAIAYIETYTPNSKGFGPAGPPDVILLDMEMPGMAGEGFLEWYYPLSTIAHVPVVAYTTDRDDELPSRCFTLGAAGFLEKPDDPTALVPVVREALERAKGDVEDEWDRRLA